MRSTILALLTTVLLTLGASAATAGGGGGGICRGFGEGSSIVMRDNCFEGTGHLVPTDETISVLNDGHLPHTITAVDGSFDSGVIAPGETFEVTLEEPGTVPVYCTLHGNAQGDGMTGLLVVGGGAAAATTPMAAGTASNTWQWVAVVLLAATGAGLLVRRRSAARLHAVTADTDER